MTIVSKHALEQFEKRYTETYPDNNPPKIGFEEKLKEFLLKAEKISKPKRMSFFNYMVKNNLNNFNNHYYSYQGWILVVVKKKDDTDLIITVYRQ